MNIGKRRIAALIAAGNVAALSLIGLSAQSSFAGSATITNACKSNATGTYSDIDIGLAGDANVDDAVAGDTIQLTNASATLNVPATLLIAGYNLGLLTVGENTVPAIGAVSIAASNTVEGSYVQTFSVTSTLTITDPDGTPGTGDESATPLTVSVAIDDTTWTATGGNVVFTQGGTLPPIAGAGPGGSSVTPVGSLFVSAQVAGGFIKANFDCSPGTSSSDGQSFTPAAPAPFETVTVPGESQTTTTAAATTTTPPTTQAPVTTTTTTAAPTTTSGPSTTVPVQQVKVSGTRTVSNACKDSVQGNYSSIDITMAADAFPHPHKGQPIELTNTKVTVAIPGSIFVTGYNLGIIQNGTQIPASVTVVVEGTNTNEGTHSYTASTTATVAITDPDGTPGSGDESAPPLAVTLDLENTTWTPKDATLPVSWAQTSAKISATVPLVTPLVVTFDCQPGTPTDTDGNDTNDSFTPSPPVPFVAVAAQGTELPVTTVPTTVATQGTAATTTTTIAATVAAQNLPHTGPDALVWWLLAGLIALDLGYFAWSATKPSRRSFA